MKKKDIEQNNISDSYYWMMCCSSQWNIKGEMILGLFLSPPALGRSTKLKVSQQNVNNKSTILCFAGELANHVTATEQNVRLAC